jgi:hypothetical protein
VHNAGSNGTLLKREKTITPIRCKIIPKTNGEQIKDNMREIIFIYTLLGTYFEKHISSQLKMSQNVSH